MAQKRDGCEVLSPDKFLPRGKFNIWDCYSEHTSTFNNRLHFHDFFELSVIYEGSSHFLINGTAFPTGAGSMQLIRPSDYHRQRTGPGEHIRYYNLMFSADFLSQPLLEALTQDAQPLCVATTGEDWDEILKQVQRIYREYEASADPLSHLVIRGGVESLCVYLLRHRQPGSTNAPVPQECIRRGVSYIQNHYREPIRLADAAAASGLSPSYFSMVFHRDMGISFSGYLTDFRLRTADRYLCSSDLPIKQIAALCGFSSCPHFVTAFKTRFGITPAARRKQDKQHGPA